MGYHVIHKRRKRRSRPPFCVDNTGPGRHPVRMSEEDRKRLGDAVRVRRGQLRLTQKDFAGRANLTPKQVIRIEKGQVEPRATTLDGLDTAGEWPPGTSKAILDGAAPPDAPAVPSRYPADLQDDFEREVWDSSHITVDDKWEVIFVWRGKKEARSRARAQQQERPPLQQSDQPTQREQFG